MPDAYNRLDSDSKDMISIGCSGLLGCVALVVMFGVMVLVFIHGLLWIWNQF